jgi:hypothetical protein
MSGTQLSGDAVTEASGPATVLMRFEVTVLPVADDDRAKAFYERLGWRLDADFPIDEDNGWCSSPHRARRRRSSSGKARRR